MPENCARSPDFDATRVGDRFGLTCGYWTNRPNDIDRHLIKFHLRGDDVYDLFDEQYEDDNWRQ